MVGKCPRSHQHACSGAIYAALRRGAEWTTGRDHPNHLRQRLDEPVADRVRHHCSVTVLTIFPSDSRSVTIVLVTLRGELIVTGTVLIAT